MTRVVQDAGKSLLNKEDFGITIYRVKSALKTYPDSAPLKYFLAEALSQGKRPSEAQASYLDAIREDAGGTELSCLALNRLALILNSHGKDFQALQCLTMSLSLDRANQQSLQIAEGLFKKHDLVQEAEKLKKLMVDRPSASVDPSVELPNRAKPNVSKKPSAIELYRTSVRSVVLLQVGDVSGSGVCIGAADSILTNYHVVAGGGTVDVCTFVYKGDTLIRLPTLKAKLENIGFAVPVETVRTVFKSP
jgi:hypothetical protein